jgi:hypothetical protein
MYKFKIFKYFHLEISYLRKLQQVHASWIFKIFF